ncbi:unnamed protein product [Ilex paraguariensis]|uniref:Uncharacterized protein n=1 Tax=Ilex paraguariensis TaxID=185542 RepID=A0ABC8TC56_9AQUA
MAETKSAMRKPVFTKIDQLRLGTNGHNIVVKVVTLDMVLQKGRLDHNQLILSKAMVVSIEVQLFDGLNFNGCMESMAETKSAMRKPVFTKIDQLRLGTNGHNIVVKVVTLDMVLQKGRLDHNQLILSKAMVVSIEVQLFDGLNFNDVNMDLVECKRGAWSARRFASVLETV